MIKIPLPHLNVLSGNPLDILLSIIAARFDYLSQHSPEFQKLLVDRKFAIKIATRTGVSCTFVVNHGHFHSLRQSDMPVDFAMTFVDSQTGLKLLTQANAALLMRALGHNQLSLSGDYSLLLWFNQAASHILPTPPEPINTLISRLHDSSKNLSRFIQRR